MPAPPPRQRSTFKSVCSDQAVPLYSSVCPLPADPVVLPAKIKPAGIEEPSAPSRAARAVPTLAPAAHAPATLTTVL